MPASVTLPTTTLTFWIGPQDLSLKLASGSGVRPGLCLWIDRELMTVVALPDANNIVKIKRGQGGTAPSEHSSTALVTIGRPDQFYTTDPVGAPGTVIAVSPYINTFNGKVWYAQGDALPNNQTVRWWQEVTGSYGTSSLGILTQTSSPTSST